MPEYTSEQFKNIMSSINDAHSIGSNPLAKDIIALSSSALDSSDFILNATSLLSKLDGELNKNHIIESYFKQDYDQAVEKLFEAADRIDPVGNLKNDLKQTFERAKTQDNPEKNYSRRDFETAFSNEMWNAAVKDEKFQNFVTEFDSFLQTYSADKNITIESAKEQIEKSAKEYIEFAFADDNTKKQKAIDNLEKNLDTLAKNYVKQIKQAPDHLTSIEGKSDMDRAEQTFSNAREFAAYKIEVFAMMEGVVRPLSELAHKDRMAKIDENGVPQKLVAGKEGIMTSLQPHQSVSEYRGAVTSSPVNNARVNKGVEHGYSGSHKTVAFTNSISGTSVENALIAHMALQGKPPQVQEEYVTNLFRGLECFMPKNGYHSVDETRNALEEVKISNSINNVELLNKATTLDDKIKAFEHATNYSQNIRYNDAVKTQVTQKVEERMQKK